MRPMFLEFPDDPLLETNGEEYMFGSDLLVAPKVWDFAAPYPVIFPKGGWYDYWTGAPVEGGRTIQVDPPLDTLPVYVRAGSILPQQPVVQNVDEAPKGPLDVRVYVGPRCAGDLYMDDGNTNAYLRGDTLRVRFSCEAKASGVDVKMTPPEGTFQPKFQALQFTIFGIPGKTESIEVDGKQVTGWKDANGSLTLPDILWAGAGHTIKILTGAK